MVTSDHPTRPNGFTPSGVIPEGRIPEGSIPDGVIPGGVTVLSRPGPRIQGAIIAAAAEMALADGRADPVERRGLLAFLKHNRMLLSFGRTATLSRFAAEIDRATQHSAKSLHGQADSARPWQDLTDRLRPLAGTEAARLVADAAAHVAAADGVVDARETELLRLLRATLGLTRATEGADA